MATFTFEQQQNLLTLVKADCKRYNVKLYLSKGMSVRNNGHSCGGYFCSSNRKLAVATNTINWPMILLHEYCHLLQWQEQCVSWRNSDQYKVDYISEWLSNTRKISPSKLDHVFDITMQVERDCEQRKIAYLKQLGFSKQDIQEETQRANAYVLFYLYVKNSQKWAFDNCASEVKKIWSACPKNFNYNLHTSYQRIAHLYDSHL